MSGHESYLLKVPPEVLHLIYKRLSYKEMDNLRLTCKYLQGTVKSFKEYYRKEWQDMTEAYEGDHEDDRFWDYGGDGYMVTYDSDTGEYSI